MNRQRIAAALVAVTLSAATVTACSTAGNLDKAGGDTAVLTLATLDDVNNNGQSYGPQAFVDSLIAVSGGRLRVDVKKEYGGQGADAETKVVKAIATGAVDGGWPSTRAFASAGISGFEAVEAPLTITSYAAEKDLVTSPVAGRLLDRLKDTGVVGLGLAVGPLRRPFATKAALVSPSAWAGARFRSFNSPTQEATVRALGGTPVSAAFDWVDQAREGKLSGVELDIAQYATNGPGPTTFGTGNVVLWPKVFVLSFSRQRFDALTEQQRTWIREAAKKATTASVEATYDESTPATQLCGQGIKFLDAAPDQLADLRRTLRPVLAGLAKDPLFHEIEAIAQRNPAVDVPTVPIVCKDSSQSFQAGKPPATLSKLPPGVYRVGITSADLAAAGQSQDPGLGGTWTLAIRPGEYRLSCRPITEPGVECATATYDGPLDAGELRGTGNTVYFTYRPALLAKLTGCLLPVSDTVPNHCFPGGGPIRMSWKLEGRMLILGDYVSDWTNVQYLIKPWQKIA
jgi:TRAP-type C4-dicarboxylate transport system substrate-binding protein